MAQLKPDYKTSEMWGSGIATTTTGANHPIYSGQLGSYSNVIMMGNLTYGGLTNLEYWYESQPRLGKTRLNDGDIRAFYEETDDKVLMQYYSGDTWHQIK